MKIKSYSNAEVDSCRKAGKITATILDELNSIIKEADYLTIHIPMTKDTKGLFNYKVFEKMKSTARIINVARGGIIDEKDLA